MTEETRRDDSDARSDDRLLGHWGASLLARFDPLIPPAIAAHGGAEPMRARMTAAGMLGAGLLYTLNGLYLLTAGDQLGVAIVDLACAAALLACLRIFRGLRRQDLFATPFLTIAFGQLLFLWLASGGTNLGALFSFSAVVVLSMMLASWRFGLVVTLASCAVVGASVVLLPAAAAASASDFSGHVYRDAVLLILGVGAISTIYDWTREVASREAKLARERAEASERASTLR